MSSGDCTEQHHPRQGFLDGPTAIGACVGAVVAVAVGWPWMNGRWLLLLDWVNGPSPRLPASVFGLTDSTASVPTVLLVHYAVNVIGPLASAVAPLAALALSAVGAARLTASLAVPIGRFGLAASALSYSYNPFVFERLSAGQVYLLFGYALLPFFVRAVLDMHRPGEPRRVIDPLRVGLWWSVSGAWSVHLLWIDGVILAVAVVLSKGRRWLGAVSALAMTAGCSTYLWVPQLAETTPSAPISTAELHAYQTIGHGFPGLLLNVVALYGFWDPRARSLRADLPAWLLLLAALLLVVGVGATVIWRSASRLTAGTLFGAALCGLVLAMGDRGPTGALYTALYLHLPGFAVMREAEKFSSLLALAYATAFGFGVEHVGKTVARPTVQRSFLGLAAALPIAYCPTLLAGLAGQVVTVDYPQSWASAQAELPSDSGAMLVLPWHQYQRETFAGRVLANPAASYFAVPVISGDNVEVPAIYTDSSSARSRYLEYLFAHGAELHDFGRLVAQLGVTYILLEHDADYGNYAWLDHQSDLQVVQRSGALTLYDNLSKLPAGTRTTAQLTVPSIAEYVALAQSVDLRGAAVEIRSGEATSPAPRLPIGGVREQSPISFYVGAGPGDGAVVPVDFSKNWASSAGSAALMADGVAFVPLPAHGGAVTYTAWATIRMSYIVSSTATGVVLAVLALQRWAPGWEVLRKRQRRSERRSKDAGSVGRT